jgi:putative FmdB family regulatory protein
VPIYEYVCAACHHRFEVQQKISDPPLTHCNRCGQSVTKVISAPAIMFKGSGWYVTDYSDKLKPPTAAATEGGSASESKTEKAGQATESVAASASPSPSASSPAPTGTSAPSTGSTQSSSSSTPAPTPS